MNRKVRILIAEDDDGHANLLNLHLKRAGINNESMRFNNGQEILHFLFRIGKGPHRKSNAAYFLLLDLKMPKVDGIEVLKKIKAESELCKIPVAILTTTQDPRDIENCYTLGCNFYLVKPFGNDDFSGITKALALLIQTMEHPQINGVLKCPSES